jgi:hypothetical protein
MKSCIYEGSVEHRRFRPVEHSFGFRMFLMYLDLEELPRLFAGRWLWSCGRPNLASFRRADYLGDPSVPLDRAVRDLVAERTGRRPAGPVRLLTHLRYFGYCYNPVSFYYCFDSGDRGVETVVAEITNTPWRERHLYVFSRAGMADDPFPLRLRVAKEFHVSPFMGMDLEYDWRLSEPGETLHARMNNFDAAGKLFDAVMVLRRRPLEGRHLSRVLARFPLMTCQVIAAIYWQALRLRLRGAPFFAHPRARDARPMEIPK